MTHHYDDDKNREARKHGFANVTFLWTAPINHKINRVKFMYIYI